MDYQETYRGFIISVDESGAFIEKGGCGNSVTAVDAQGYIEDHTHYGSRTIDVPQNVIDRAYELEIQYSDRFAL